MWVMTSCAISYFGYEIQFPLIRFSVHHSSCSVPSFVLLQPQICEM